MKREPKDADLLTIANGAVPEMFDMALQEALENIHDPNTPVRGKRTVTIKVILDPTEDAQGSVGEIKASATVDTKLLPVRSAQGTLYTARREGRIQARVVDTRQDGFFTTDPQVAEMPQKGQEQKKA